MKTKFLMLFKLLFLLIYIVFFNGISCSAQESSKFSENNQHNIFLEFCGNSFFIYNITYDFSFQIAKKQKIAVGLGGQYSPSGINMLFRPSVTGIYPQINYLYGENNAYLEVGTGYTFFWFYPGGVELSQFVPLRIGYRYQKDNGGLFWKIAFVTFWGDQIWWDGYKVTPWGGVAFGYTFKKRE